MIFFLCNKYMLSHACVLISPGLLKVPYMPEFRQRERERAVSLK